jgi:transposase
VRDLSLRLITLLAPAERAALHNRVGLANRGNHGAVRQSPIDPGMAWTRLRPRSSRSSCSTASISGARGAFPPFALPQAARNASAAARRQKKHGRCPAASATASGGAAPRPHHRSLRYRRAGPYSQDLRDRVVGSVVSGRSCRATAALFGVSVASVVKWSQRWRASGSAAAKEMGGWRQLRLKRERAWLLARIAEKPDLTLLGPAAARHHHTVPSFVQRPKLRVTYPFEAHVVWLPLRFLRPHHSTPEPVMLGRVEPAAGRSATGFPGTSAVARPPRPTGRSRSGRG